ncbi:hypothetical protein JD844_015359, partial [Phrynosoma platyrhinos]
GQTRGSCSKHSQDRPEVILDPWASACKKHSPHCLCQGRLAWSPCLLLRASPVLGALCRGPLLRQADDRGDLAGRGPERPGLVWGRGPAGLHGGRPHHVPSGQRLWPLPLRGALRQHLSWL